MRLPSIYRVVEVCEDVALTNRSTTGPLLSPSLHENVHTFLNMTDMAFQARQGAINIENMCGVTNMNEFQARARDRYEWAAELLDSQCNAFMASFG